MISTGWKIFSWMIDAGMRGGIPVEKHDNVVTFYGDYSGYQKVPGMENTNLAYVFYWTRRYRPLERAGIRQPGDRKITS